MLSRASHRTRRALVAVALTSAALGGAFWAGQAAVAPAHAVPQPVAPAASALALPNFAGIVEQHGPAVVNVSVTGVTRAALPGVDPDDPFYEFFRRFGGNPRGGERPTHGVGSGFIVDADGVVLTNAHVVAEASEVVVKLTDKREFKAKVVGVDRETDVAVLRIDAKALPTVRIGDPGRTRVGDWVVAIGSPFGFENSVTSGIVSAKSRALPDEGYVPFLQTDVAINPGNSGGPLFNLDGEVIGINSQIYSRSGGYQGLSFAIPIDVAMKVGRQLLDRGSVRRGRLGIGVQEVDQALADAFGLDRPRGALVSQVEPDSPAARAGLRQGDVIIGLDGQEIARSSDLPPKVADLAPGRAVRLEVWRERHATTLTATLGERGPALAQATKPAAAGGRLGLAVRPLSEGEKGQAGLAGGLLVEDVDGPAGRAGIRPGDVIVAVNGQPVAAVEQLRRLAGEAGKRIALLVQRNGSRLYVPLELG